jgi:hypothetical protein
MSDVIDVLRALVRDELSRQRPTALGKVTQVFPKDSDDSSNNHQVNVRLHASGLELQRVPVVCSRIGWSTLPREGDLMLITFVGGDLNAPVALGCLYDDQAHPPQAAQDEVVYQPPDAAQSGVRRFYIELPSGTKVTLDDDVLKIEAGETTLSVGRDGDVELKAKGNIHLTADGDIQIDAQGDLKLSAQGNVSISGMSSKFEGQTEAKISGPQLSFAGMTQFSPS